MGRGEKAKRINPLSPFPSHHSLLGLYALVPIIPLSRFSRAREFPNPHLALGKPVEEQNCNRFSGSCLMIASDEA